MRTRTTYLLQDLQGIGRRRAYNRVLASIATTPAAVPSVRTRTAFVVCLLAYVCGRACQLLAGRLPSELIALSQVAPPAAFALVHGAITYRRRGILVFTACCLGVGALSESVSLSTGFPFGHYYFTDVMGPKVFGLPPLLVLAYLGMGYLSWILALIILGYRDQPLRGVRAFIAPLVASSIMLAWDVSMEPDWATIDRAWIWKDGGLYFGIPLTNFAGWLVTGYVYYQLFALYCRGTRAIPKISNPRHWQPAILFYGICAAANLLIAIAPMAPSVVTDASGVQWNTARIVLVCTAFSILGMLPIALAAWVRLRRPNRASETSR